MAIVIKHATLVGPLGISDDPTKPVNTAEWDEAHTVTGLEEVENTALSTYGVTGLQPMCRLTTESGVPVSTADRTAQGTLFACPCIPNGMALTTAFIPTYTGSVVRKQEFSQVSQALTLTSGKNYDVFVKNSDLSIVLSSAWTNDTTRADALAVVKGLIVANADNTYTWLGTIRASGANVIEDSAGGTTTQVGGKRFVWNAHNQVRRSLSVVDKTDTWGYTTDTIRQANGAAGNKIEYVTGDASTSIDALINAGVYLTLNSARSAQAGVGIDSTTTYSGLVAPAYAVGTGVYMPIAGRYAGMPGLGYHAISWNEKGADGTCLFIGDVGGLGPQSGLIATVMM